MQHEQVDRAIEAGDIEALFAMYSKATTEKDGQNVINKIEKAVPRLCLVKELPVASSFKKLVANYDRRQFHIKLIWKKLREITEELRRSRGTWKAERTLEAFTRYAEYTEILFLNKRDLAELLLEMVRKLGVDEKIVHVLAKTGPEKQRGGTLEPRMTLLADQLGPHFASLLSEEKDQALVTAVFELYEQAGALYPLAQRMRESDVGPPVWNL